MMHLFIDAGLIDQHDRYVVALRIETVTGNAAQPRSIGLKFHFRPARRADQYFEEFSADSHWEMKRLVYQDQSKKPFYKPLLSCFTFSANRATSMTAL